jgi:hypothetical protein
MNKFKVTQMIREIDPLDEASVIELAHEMAMSDEPNMAAAGRLLKAIGPGWGQFIHDEVKRKSDPNHGINAMLSSFGLLTGMIVGMTQDGPENLNDETFTEKLAAGFKECLPKMKIVTKSQAKHVTGNGFVMVNSDKIEC